LQDMDTLAQIAQEADPACDFRKRSASPVRAVSRMELLYQRSETPVAKPITPRSSVRSSTPSRNRFLPRSPVTSPRYVQSASRINSGTPGRTRFISPTRMRLAKILNEGIIVDPPKFVYGSGVNLRSPRSPTRRSLSPRSLKESDYKIYGTEGFASDTTSEPKESSIGLYEVTSSLGSGKVPPTEDVVLADSVQEETPEEKVVQRSPEGGLEELEQIDWDAIQTNKEETKPRTNCFVWW